MDAVETSRKRNAEVPAHEMDDVRRDESMVDESMQEARRDAQALGAHAVAPVTDRNPATSWCARIKCRRGDGPALGMGSGTGG